MASASVFVVGADDLRKNRLVRDIEAAGFGTRTGMPGRREDRSEGCIVLDTVSATSFSRETVLTLGAELPAIPVIAVCAGHAAERVAEAFRGGAFDVIVEPTPAASLRHIITCAIAESRYRDEDVRFTTDVSGRLSKLSRGEHDVLECVVDGTSNQSTADSLGVGLRTVEARRARVLEKLAARSIPHLVAMLTRHRQIEGYARRLSSRHAGDGHFPFHGEGRFGSGDLGRSSDQPHA